MPYGRDQFHPVATALCEAGFVVWNVGYRRVGPGGHAWPATLDDIGAALSLLPRIEGEYPVADPGRLFLVGHSAGGHLAFWGAARAARLDPRLQPTAAIGLAPLLDLEAAYRAGLGSGAVEQFLGGTPSTVAERYAFASPRALLPLGVRQCLLHGEEDTVVPLELSRTYATAATRAGDVVTCIGLPGDDHMAFLDPSGTAYRELEKLLTTLREMP